MKVTFIINHKKYLGTRINRNYSAFLVARRNNVIVLHSENGRVVTIGTRILIILQTRRPLKQA